ncbi:MAG: hypothetical protein AAGA75_17750 [Cyanobacteria bacterium P01_E01_bin.6]
MVINLPKTLTIRDTHSVLISSKDTLQSPHTLIPVEADDKLLQRTLKNILHWQLFGFSFQLLLLTIQNLASMTVRCQKFMVIV